jgi:protein disulfide-isomerase A1
MLLLIPSTSTNIIFLYLEYAKAATTLAKDGVKLAKVDATVESELGSRFGVTGYPTLKVFRKGTPTDYKGPRDAAGIASYMQKQAAPAISVFKSLAELEKFVQDEGAIVYFGEPSGKVHFHLLHITHTQIYSRLIH